MIAKICYGHQSYRESTVLVLTKMWLWTVNFKYKYIQYTMSVPKHWLLGKNSVKYLKNINMILLFVYRNIVLYNIREVKLKRNISETKKKTKKNKNKIKKPTLKYCKWTRGSALTWACVTHLSFCFEET